MLTLQVDYSRYHFALESSLNQEEWRRYQMFCYPHLQDNYHFAHCFKRAVLSYYNPDTAPKDWQFRYSRSGKPHTEQNIAFNLSHSEQAVAIVSVKQADTNNIGVDIECYRLLDDLDTLAAQVLHRHEITILMTQSAPATAFYKLWTAKEALLKAAGTGLIDQLQLIDCSQSLRSSEPYNVEWLQQPYVINTLCLGWGCISFAWQLQIQITKVNITAWTSGTVRQSILV